MIEIDNIYNMDCLEGMRQMESESVDLTVTSPPYDNLRTYNGYCFDFENIAKELYRVTKQGGVVVWVVGDATIDGSETGTSFRQALYFMECGFKLYDTMLYMKANPIPQNQRRYEQVFEYTSGAGGNDAAFPQHGGRVRLHMGGVLGTVLLRLSSGEDRRGNEPHGLPPDRLAGHRHAGGRAADELSG